MNVLTSKATFQRVLDRLAAVEPTLPAREDAASRGSLPARLAELDFLFAAPEEILSVPEHEVFKRLHSEDIDFTQPCGLRPQTVLVMKATRLCNLRCTYCNAWREGPNQVMTFEVLAKTTRDILRRPEVNRATFVWHGGEVTMLPIEFFKKALWLQQVFRAKNQTVSNCIQTNATRLNDEWMALFAIGNFQVGVSIDGPHEIHDRRRKTKSGQPTWEKVRAGITRLRKTSLPWGALVVVDREVVECGAKRLLDSLLELGVADAGLLNVIPENSGRQPGKDDYLPWAAYVEFLTEIFRCWWPNYRDKIDIRELSALVNNLSGRAPNTCVHAGNCMGQFLTVEPNGTVNACDKYVGDKEFEFGNVLDSNLNALLANSKNLARAQTQTQLEAFGMSDCKYFACCRGGCPHDRRLNRLYQTAAGDRCCGLSDLLDEIVAALHNNPVPRKEPIRQAR
jgi:uncharacterized protein